MLSHLCIAIITSDCVPLYGVRAYSTLIGFVSHTGYQSAKTFFELKAELNQPDRATMFGGDAYGYRLMELNGVEAPTVDVLM